MPKIGEHALVELESRWRSLFRTLEAGGEVSPSQRLRAEGFMEALVVMGVAEEAALQDALEACYLECRGDGLPEDWRELFPFPQVPGFGQRAPVYPSTSDQAG
jgi:hypothetical protein